MPSISIIIATQGRPTLQRAVESILPQLREGDEILCIGDDFCPDVPEAVCIADFSPLPSQFGNRQRNTATTLAKGDVLCFLDDDDWHLDGSLDAIRSIETVTMFRAVLPHGVTVWKDRTIRRGNVGTCTIAVPRIPSKIPPWPVDPHPPGGVSPRGSDFLFIRECVRRFGGVAWREEVVYCCGPRG
jgi:glycosyltransferase involved in cell wall biosynthesis